MKHVISKIDKKNINARHFASMSKEDAVKALIADKIAPNAEWAGKAYEQFKADIAESDKKEKEAAATEQLRLKAVQELNARKVSQG